MKHRSILSIAALFLIAATSAAGQPTPSGSSSAPKPRDLSSDDAKLIAELKKLDVVSCLSLPGSPTRPVYKGSTKVADRPDEMLAQINVSKEGAVTAVSFIASGGASIYGGRGSGAYEGTAAGKCAAEKIKAVKVVGLSASLATTARWVVECDSFNEKAINCRKD